MIKYIFGREETKDLLLSFINAVLEDSGLNPIVSFELKNPFNFKEFEDDKMSILDVKATDNTRRIFDIEVQSYGDESYTNRSLYYWSKLYSSQLLESDEYTILKPVECINILNFRLIDDIKRFHSCYIITEKDDPKLILTDHLLIHFIELPKVETSMLDSKLQKWSQFFINEGKEENNIMNTILKDDPILQKAHDEYVKFTGDDELREIYESRLKYKRDHLTLLRSAEKRGEKKGEKQKAIDTAKKMIEEGMDNNLIARITGLSIPDIEKLFH